MDDLSGLIWNAPSTKQQPKQPNQPIQQTLQPPLMPKMSVLNHSGSGFNTPMQQHTPAVSKQNSFSNTPNMQRKEDPFEKLLQIGQQQPVHKLSLSEQQKIKQQQQQQQQQPLNKPTETAWNFDVLLNQKQSPQQTKGNESDPLSDFLSGKSNISSTQTTPQQQSGQASPQKMADDPLGLFSGSSGSSSPVRPVNQSVNQPVNRPVRPAEVVKPKPAEQQPKLPDRPAEKQLEENLDQLIGKMMELGFGPEESKNALLANQMKLQPAIESLLYANPNPSKKQTGVKLMGFLNKAKNMVQEKLTMAMEQTNQFVMNRQSSSGSLELQQQQQQQQQFDFDIKEEPLPVQKPKTKRQRNRPPVEASSQQIELSQQYKEQGNDYFKRGQYGDALSAYSQAIEQLPKGHLLLLPLLNNRNASCLKTGDYKQSIEDGDLVEQMIEEELQYYQYIEDNSVIQSENDVIQKEIDLKVQELKDALSKALLRRATAYESIEKWKDAARDYSKSLKVCPGAKGASDGLRRCEKMQRTPQSVAEVKPVVEVSTAATANQDLLFDPFAAQTSAPAPTAVKMTPLQSLAQPVVQQEVGDSQRVQQLRLQNQQQEKEDSEKLKLKDSVDQKIINWKQRKENNLRALLSSLDTILWSEMDWKPLQMSELVTPGQVKVKYMKAISKLHPDKLSSMQLTVEQKLLANSLFSSLNDAWDIFRQQNQL